MVHLEKVRYNLITAIMRITDLSKLEKMYELAEEEVKKENITKKPKPPTVEIKSGVSLEEIKKSQETSPISFSEITEMFQDEPWGQSLEELLTSID